MAVYGGLYGVSGAEHLLRDVGGDLQGFFQRPARHGLLLEPSGSGVIGLGVPGVGSGFNGFGVPGVGSGFNGFGVPGLGFRVVF